MNPRVTFIIAHHNYQQYLEGCVMSALNQTYDNVHVCVIDDCSDNQEQVKAILENIENFIAEEIRENGTLYYNNHISYIALQKDNGSYRQAYARNIGIEECWGNTDFFAILDADDENYPTKIERSIEVMQDPRVGAVYTDTNIVTVEDNRMVREYREPFDYFRLMQECIVHSGCVLRKTALEDVLENGKVFDEELPPCEDYDLWVRLSEKYLFYHIPEPLVYVRVHPQNSTATSTHEHRMSRIQRIFQKRQQRLQ